jgi:hypothetical protein
LRKSLAALGQPPGEGLPAGANAIRLDREATSSQIRYASRIAGLDFGQNRLGVGGDPRRFCLPRQP